jgi:hypothetical protein
MADVSKPTISVHERALRLALKETMARQRYAGIVPAAPDYQIVARRALEIERALKAEQQHARV